MSQQKEYDISKIAHLIGKIYFEDPIKADTKTYTSHGSNHYFAEGFYYTYNRGSPEYVFECPHCKKETRYSIEISRLKD